MTDLPQWAMEKANEHLERWKFDSMTIVFARALVEAEVRGIEKAVKVAGDAITLHTGDYLVREVLYEVAEGILKLKEQNE